MPTFRDGDGLWKRYDAMEVSSISGMAGEPAKVWAFEREFNDILNACSGPNAGHRALAELEGLGCIDLVVTQNVDGFQQAAGSKEVLELHGSEVHAICLNKECGHRVEMRQLFEGPEADKPFEDGGLWSPLAKGWGVRWPECTEDSELQRAVRMQLARLQRRRNGSSSSGAGSSSSSSATVDISSDTSSCSSGRGAGSPRSAGSGRSSGRSSSSSGACAGLRWWQRRQGAAASSGGGGGGGGAKRRADVDGASAGAGGGIADAENPTPEEEGKDKAKAESMQKEGEKERQQEGQQEGRKGGQKEECQKAGQMAGQKAGQKAKAKAKGKGKRKALKKKARIRAKKRSLAKSCRARALKPEELEKGPPECRVPICPKCRRGALKPDGIFFGEALSKPVLERSVRQSLKSKVVMMVGTSGQVDPAAKLPLLAKKRNGAKIVEVNIGETHLSKLADIRLRGPSASVLPDLARLVAAHPRLKELTARKRAREAVVASSIAGAGK